MFQSATESSDWTADQLQDHFKIEIQSIDYALHGTKHTAHALPLLALLKSAGLITDLKMDPKADPKTKNLPLREIVIIRGRDGYTVAFSLAELLPAIGNHPAWLALDADSKALPDAETPARLIAPDDSLPGRWVRGIAEISVVDVSTMGGAKP